MINEPVIEPMSPAHISAVAGIEEICFSQPWSENALAGAISRPDALFFIAFINGKAAGYIGAHNVLGEVGITNVAVLPEYRRTGIGEKLINTLKAAAENNSAVLLTLEVRESNTGAIKLYEKTGFNKIGIRKDYYFNPRENAVIYTEYLDGDKNENSRN